MNFSTENDEMDGLTYEEKNHRLFLKQQKTLELFLERNAISKEQYEKSIKVIKARLFSISDDKAQNP